VALFLSCYCPWAGLWRWREAEDSRHRFYHSNTLMCQISQRNIAAPLLVSVLFALSLPVSGAAFTEGSTATARSSIDIAVGQVFIYNGGFFDLGNSEKVTTFTWFGEQFTGSRFMTPLLIHQLPIGVFTIAGIGTGRTVTSSGTSQSFLFGLTQGTDTTGLGGLWVFGFVNGLVDGNGNQTSSSAGTVDMVTPFEAGSGIEPLSSNDWVYTSLATAPTVAVGTTFFSPGGAGNIPLNDPSKGQLDRTYSANLTGVDASVPEPASLLLTGIALLGIGFIAMRRKKKLCAAKS
jgi:hypothetical protein